jgi:hypothetical protein
MLRGHNDEGAVMTNSSTYPSWRDYYGIIIEFDDTHYSWSINSPAQRKYLLNSDYCDGAKRVYVCNIKKWFGLSEFKEYLRTYKFEKWDKTKNDKSEKEEKVTTK